MNINVNLKSAFNLTKAVQRPMLKARSGSIINMSSVVGVKGNAGQSNYAASKAGLIELHGLEWQCLYVERSALSGPS